MPRVPAMTGGRGPVRVRLAVAVALLAGLTLALATFVSSTRVTHGFASYYAAARAVSDGRFGAWVYDDLAFGAHLRQVTASDVRDIFAPNTPAMALVASPLAGLPHRNARGVWLAVSLLALFLSVQWLAADARPRAGEVTWILAASVLVSPAVLENIRTAQAYTLTFGLATAATWGLLHQRHLLAGAALGIACILKPTFAPWILVLLCQGRFSVVLAAAGAASLPALLSLPFVGLDSWLAWPGVALTFASRPETSVTAYQTTLGFVRHLCTADPRWNPAAPLACGPATVWLPPVLSVTATLVTCSVGRRASMRSATAAAVCLSLLMLPIAEDHQFITLAIPLFLAPADTARQRAWLAVVVVLWLLPPQLTWERFTDGWWSLLAYPRLYATWLLWARALIAARAHPA